MDKVCRPANLPKGCPGRTHLILEKDGFRLGVFTVMGRAHLKIRADCPFRCADKLLKELMSKTSACLVEIHAEFTSEKIAMGWFLDGRASAVLGTHTHVQTADETIHPKGTAYLSDVGMTGPMDSVLGREREPVIASLLDSMPRKFTVAKENPKIHGCLVELDPKTGKAVKIERLQVGL
jgi:metallophosphoesterase (TIGR00282 family)